MAGIRDRGRRCGSYTCHPVSLHEDTGPRDLVPSPRTGTGCPPASSIHQAALSLNESRVANLLLGLAATRHIIARTSSTVAHSVPICTIWTSRVIRRYREDSYHDTWSSRTICGRSEAVMIPRKRGVVSLPSAISKADSSHPLLSMSEKYSITRARVISGLIKS